MRQQFDQSEPPTATNDSSGEVLSVQHVDAGHPDERVLIEISRFTSSNVAESVEFDLVRLEQPSSSGAFDCFSSVIDTQLPVDRPQVRLDGVHRYEKVGPDLTGLEHGR